MRTEKQKKSSNSNWLIFYFTGVLNSSVNYIKKFNLGKRINYLLVTLMAISRAIITLQKAKPVWKQGNGTLIKIEDMGSDHIEACISFLKRGGVPKNTYIENSYWIFLFEAELYHRNNNP